MVGHYTVMQTWCRAASRGRLKAAGEAFQMPVATPEYAISSLSSAKPCLALKSSRQRPVPAAGEYHNNRDSTMLTTDVDMITVLVAIGINAAAGLNLTCTWLWQLRLSASQ